MIEVLTGRDAALYPNLFERMHRQRHEIYVVRRGWKALHSENGIERDCFDIPDAQYVLALDEEDDILASMRLLPSTGPHLLADVFPKLILSGDVPRGDDIYELTRFYVAPFGASREVRDWLVGVLSAGAIEHCLDIGIRHITSVIDTFLLKLMLSMDWKVRPLGLPQRYPEGIAVAVMIDITPAALVATRRTKGVEGPVLASRLPLISRIPASVRAGQLAPSRRAMLQ